VTYGAATPVTPPHYQPRRMDAWSLLAFSLAVLALLIYSQGWMTLLTGGNVGDASKSSLIRDMFLPAYAAGIVLLAMTPGATLGALLRQPFLILLMVIVAASLIWSDAPDQTMRRIVALYATTLTGVVLASRYSWATLTEIIGATYLILAVLCFLLIFGMPGIGKMTEIFPGAWRGAWPEKNALGGNMALGFGLCVAAALLNPRRAWLWWGAAALTLLLVLGSTSKTSLISVVLGSMALGFVFLVRRGPASGVMATFAAVVGAMFLAGFLLFASDVFLGFLGKDATLTGRTKIWAAVYHQIQLRPWTGYGYGATWDNESGRGALAWITKEAGFRARHAHNSWLEQWLSLGMSGLVAWSLFWLQSFGAAVLSAFRHKGAYLALPYLAVYTLTTLTESIAVAWNDLRWVIFVAIAVKLAWPDKER
jgi:exopolysaccharide production protein ExoQ